MLADFLAEVGLVCAPITTLYLRVAAKHPEHRSIAIGHAMRKLLHLAFALWKAGKPFDPARHAPAPPDGAGPDGAQAAGHTPDVGPAEGVVTAACGDTVGAGVPAGEGAYVDFAHVKRQLPMERVLGHLGLAARLRGSGAQRRCACPIHGGVGRGRTFSVNLEEGVFCCFDTRCGKKGDVIDLWAALHRGGLREAALDLVNTFGLEAALGEGTEKRDG